MQVNQQLFTQSGIALLRVSLGVMYLAHSILLKVMVFGVAGTAGYFVSLGLPRWLAYATVFAEAIGGLAILLGIKARWFALALLPILVGALVTAHAHNGWVFSAPGGGWEYPAYLIVLSVAQFLLGDGALAIAPSRPLELTVREARNSKPSARLA